MVTQILSANRAARVTIVSLELTKAIGKPRPWNTLVRIAKGLTGDEILISREKKHMASERSNNLSNSGLCLLLGTIFIALGILILFTSESYLDSVSNTKDDIQEINDKMDSGRIVAFEADDDRKTYLLYKYL